MTVLATVTNEEEKKKKKKKKETYNLLLSYRLHVDRDVKGFGFGENRANLKNK